MGARRETCGECGFDGAHYTVTDARGTLRSLATRWRWTTEGVDPSLLLRRPAPATWSLAEYAAHSRDVIALMGLLLHAIATRDRPVFVAPAATDARADEEPAALDFAAVVDELAANASRLDRKAATLARSDWSSRTAVIGGDEVDAGWVLRHAVHDSSHHLVDAGRVMRAVGALPPPKRTGGIVAQLSVSGGGVPKLAIDSALVSVRGLAGDRQASRKHHGRPWQAVCLWSAEVIDALRAEGHPVAAGAAGENVTVAGLDWSDVRPGIRLGIGESVRLEVTAYATPCKKNARWFAAGDISRMDHDVHPGWSRVYAAVRRAGVLRAGDAVVIEPD